MPKANFTAELAELLAGGSLFVFPTLPEGAPSRNAHAGELDRFRSDAIAVLEGIALISR